MRYSYEFKRKAIELFHQGEWPETPTGVLTHTFHEQIIKWAKQEQFNGPEINKHNPDKRCWSPEKKYELVCQVLFGESIRSVSIRAGINTGQLYQWVHKYKTLGYNGLINKSKGQPLLADLLIASCCALITEYSPSTRFKSLATVEW